VNACSYLLGENEERWEKNMPQIVEDLIAVSQAGLRWKKNWDEKLKAFIDPVIPPFRRDKTQLVTFKVPHNSAIQLFDYKAMKQRVLFGPDLVMLEPYEQFTVISMSAGRPKREGAQKALYLNLGPDFMTDIITVETADHAKISLTLTYSWKFSFDRTK
jgi:major vault protein